MRLALPAQLKANNYDIGKWRILCEQTFPAAKTAEAIMLAIDYCQVRNLDIFKKPVNIVPMWNSTLGKEVETIWPGINEVQITAARTREWAGMDRPEWGPDKTQTFKGWRYNKKDQRREEVEVTLTFPEWCIVPIYRMVAGERRKFEEPVFWLETYSTAGAQSELPTQMWIDRPRGQFHKVAKAAALRAAFPEEGESTADEMQGKTIEAGGVIIDQPVTKPFRQAAIAAPTEQPFVPPHDPETGEIIEGKEPATAKPETAEAAKNTADINAMPPAIMKLGGWSAFGTQIVDLVTRAQTTARLGEIRQRMQPFMGGYREWSPQKADDLLTLLATAQTELMNAENQASQADPEGEALLGLDREPKG